MKRYFFSLFCVKYPIYAERRIYEISDNFTDVLKTRLSQKSQIPLRHSWQSQAAKPSGGLDPQSADNEQWFIGRFRVKHGMTDF